MDRHSEKIANLERMRALAAYDLFDPGLGERLQAICRRSAERLGMPIAAVQAVLDTATATLAATATIGASDDEHLMVATGGGPNEFAFCPQVLLDDAPFVADDLARHPIHGANPIVRAGLIRSYAGVPLRLPSGHILGSHCVMGGEPHAFTGADLAELAAAGDAAVAAIRDYELART
ncbi:GAF domain-containing protein [Dactylosporangium sp. CA-052675]|uniref:GAF domain-containing protein n=1 Tax=Dactylosporangium sp. CA-052675 TaxID=3239927 RepID=UPI003D91AD1F